MHMNYKRIHDEIINRAVERAWTKSTAPVYVELHHILPKSMCRYTKSIERDEYVFDMDSEEKSNLVVLTAREHFLVHWLLFKIYNNNKMAHAWHRLANDNRHNSHSYRYAREAHAKAISQTLTGIKRAPFSEEHRENLKKAWENREPTSDTTKEKMSKSRKGVSKSKEHSQKIREALLNLPVVTCPHCGKQGKKGGAMTRHHFDNCKSK
ncbi:homing endonuclease [Vibrio phage phi-pp2]|uniref:Homing endonuclease n=1 Tax=Vibrio phage phi-pp2 TaxID=1204514 RepID=I6X240_9CAUD|nr:homing endonuclease [Vibrio phage phi-pp2]